MLGSVFSEVCSPCNWISEIRDVSPTPSAGVTVRSGIALGMGATLGLTGDTRKIFVSNIIRANYPVARSKPRFCC